MQINAKHIETICRQMLRSLNVTRVGDADFLAEGANAWRVDYLRGLKENAIVGRLIPAGTGMRQYREMYMEKEEPALAPTLEDLLRPEDEDAALTMADFADEQ